MGQQPNIELEISDLPRPTPTTAAPRRWKPSRPGELGSPEEVPWGGAFGTAGPDTGYALKLVAALPIPLKNGERRHNVEAALVAIAGARASAEGRAPTDEDLDVAMLLLGFDVEGLPEDLVTGLETDRVEWLANLGHDNAKARALVTSISRDVLASSPDAIRQRMRSGERLVDR
jgi:hypothetical protein